MSERILKGLRKESDTASDGDQAGKAGRRGVWAGLVWW